MWLGYLATIDYILGSLCSWSTAGKGRPGSEATLCRCGLQQSKGSTAETWLHTTGRTLLGGTCAFSTQPKTSQSFSTRPLNTLSSV